MTALSAPEVARFLQDHPEFFQQHADIFADLKVPHPHEARAISLGERQILTLRARSKELEWKLAGLLYNASGNERISQSVADWCACMLAEDDARRLPEHILNSLNDVFDLAGAALRVWGLSGLEDTPYTRDVDGDTQQFARDLAIPYCGPLQDQRPAQWLPVTPASLAIIALPSPATQEPIGLLVLGSEEADRFTSDMGTDFLQMIGRLAGASLSRLAPTAVPDCA